ncbi:MAG: hypothetical protein IGS38_04280 [Synechococcales cyanobacterium M58_A2018_015]|jgi:hypothetical protein|nr:hypothetical protein [Synechococcales cyanobacterium M58_A2018_015]
MRLQSSQAPAQRPSAQHPATKSSVQTTLLAVSLLAVSACGTFVLFGSVPVVAKWLAADAKSPAHQGMSRLAAPSHHSRTLPHPATEYWLNPSARTSRVR